MWLRDQRGFIGDILLLIVALGFVAYVLLHVWQVHRSATGVHDYNSCVAAGGLTTLSYPASCRSSDGQTFTQ